MNIADRWRSDFVMKRLLTVLCCACLCLAAVAARPALLPMPQQVEWGQAEVTLEGVRFGVPSGWKTGRGGQVVAVLGALRSEHGLAADEGYPVRFVMGEVEVPRFPEEAYRIEVTPEGATVTANGELGHLRAVQTIRQLMVSTDGRTTLPVCRIVDYPAFKVRGFMHDVGRNFQSIEQLRMQVDIMAAYKLNVFHWHLSDHYGWRLESRKYPGLQEDEAFTRGIGDYYTQQEFVDMVNYCWERGIMVLPEFDSPGHSGAFRKGIGIETMMDPRAETAMVGLIDELCGLVPAERMPWIHLGTDEAHAAAERVPPSYLPALHEVVHGHGREVVGWWKGIQVPGDTRQILQTWAKAAPTPGKRHIDSRSNYINHLTALDAPLRFFFQQPCRVPHGDEINLGGILCYWPDLRVSDEKAGLRISPVLLSMVAYSESVWRGLEEDRPEFWAKVPPQGSKEFEAFRDFEQRLVEHRDRFMDGKPFHFVRTTDIPWRLLGPIRNDELPELPEQGVRELYQTEAGPYRWTKPIHGGTIHSQHFFGFPGHLKAGKGDDTVYAFTRIHSEEAREVDAWINFNTVSSSDYRAGVARPGNWNANPACDVWLNGERVDPPEWKSSGDTDKETPITDGVFTNREPTKLSLRKGWNTILLRTAPKWKWCFTFAPIEWDGMLAREVEGLKYSVDFPPAE